MISRKLFFVIFAMLILSLALVACGSGEADCADEETICVGLVTDVGEVDDKGFNQAAWEAVQLAEEEFDAIVDYVETKDAKDYGANIDLFAEQDYDVIVTSGFGMSDATREAGQKYPDITFIGSDQWQADVIDNVAGILYPEDVAGFLAGSLAAMLTETGTVAGVYGTDLVPPVVAFKVGYENGAAYINPDVNVISTFHPGGMDVAFTDPEWGASTAKQAIDQGADVVFGAGGKTGNGAIIEAASVEGLYCIGVDLDQWLTVPETHPCLVTSAIKLLTPTIFGLIGQALDGNMQGGNNFGPAGLAPYHDFEDVIPADVKAKIAEIDAALKDGSLSTGYSPG
ncbi:MAG TPA: BMP family ABC transporter substrate-binding protein [candidate division Zixibacteria bacterium]|nr:BMP family ABC transporter substrate-binding protein [candidate division Zixibacteria bacterium]